MYAGATAGGAIPVVAAAPIAQQKSSAGPPVESQPRVCDNIVDRIELLAIQLLSLSKSRKAEPEALLREALLSIEDCIVAIGSKH